MQHDILRIRNYVNGTDSDPLFKPIKRRVREAKDRSLLKTVNNNQFCVTELTSVYYDAGITINSYTFSSSRMGSVSLSASLMYPLCLDDFWDGTQYVKFRGENYFIRQIPSSSKNNTDTRYEHEIVFVSGRDMLNNVYFFDVVSDNPNANDKYVSNSTKVVFMGTINEFAERLNRSLAYSNLSYRVVVDESI
ncbi:MAG: hypothetical protein ACRCXV_00455, partial [Bacteroidales bacterium]